MSLTYRRLDYRRIPEVARERQELADTYRQTAYYTSRTQPYLTRRARLRSLAIPANIAAQSKPPKMAYEAGSQFLGLVPK